jgi:II/X family phage/plasmid replication protein
MNDKLDIRIPFKAQYVHFLAASTPEKPAAYVNFQDYSFPIHAPEVSMVDGQPQITYYKNRDWDSISSGIAGMAIGFFPQGQGLNTYPSVSIKASPAKILQGHNVFGSEFCKEAVLQMMVMLSLAYSDIYEHLDIENAELRFIDCTYSARIRDFFSTKVFSMFESLASKRTKVNKDTDYIQLGKGSEYQRQKLYKKLQEVLADLADATKTKNTFRMDILSDQRLLDFATDLHRFEATTGHRKLALLGVPTNIWEFLKFEKWFFEVHKTTLCRYLWEQAFNSLFAQFEGHTVKNVDDTNIRLEIDKKFITTKFSKPICDCSARKIRCLCLPVVKISKRKANAIYATYQDIKREGYASLLKQDSKTFFRNVKHLEECGISRAFLKSLDPHKPTTNVIPFVQIIKIDFSNQRPDWWVEPKAEYSENTPERLLRLVG